MYTLSALVALLSPLAVADGLASNNASLKWGPYRSNLYLGIRPRVPESLLFGIMWGKLDGSEKDLRHSCEAADGMASSSWTAYDTRHGGTQTIEDQINEIDLTTDFVKKVEGQGAGNWALRVKGTPRLDHPSGVKTRVVFYVAMEAMDACADCQLDAAVIESMQANDTPPEAVNVHVEHSKLGTAEVRMPKPKGMGEHGRHTGTVVKSVRPAKEWALWDAKSLFQHVVAENDGALPNGPGPGSMHFVQYTFNDAFEFDILYSTQTATVAMSSDQLTAELNSTIQTFEKRFSSVFAPNSPFGTENHAAFSRTVFSNLQGGLSYFYGKNTVERSGGNGGVKAGTQGPYELLTHVPSRSFFPRGFLWDEGFHLLLILEWDADLALEVVRSWLSLIDSDGWIAREQILGAEAESKVPKEFRVQATNIANPPTLFWIVSNFVDMLQKKTKYNGHESNYHSVKEKGRALIEELYPKLKKHYEWWRSTQAGDVESHSQPHTNLDEGYRWRGRKPHSNFASGLDDFPRAEPPDTTELHVDALSWVGVMASALEKLALYTSNEIDIVTFRTHTRNIRQNIETLHWSEDQQMYCDVRIWDSKHDFTCPKGYVSLSPFMLGFLGPEHPHLNATLDLIRSPKHLWTDFGVRSLSPESSYYGTGDNYWRSPIWININYLLIERLLFLAQRDGPLQHRCREIYNELRVNVGNTVYNSWKDTGYAWEQFNEYGKGQRTAGFTGWTALVVKIIAFPDLGTGMGVKGAVKGGLGWAVKEAEEQGRWGGGAILIAMVGMVFIWFTRRRFVGTLRGWRRNV